MRRSWLILVGGLLLGLAAYAGVYLVSTARMRSMAESQFPALAWMQQEYHLSDTQFSRLCELHEAYRPHCMEMCQMVSEKNAELQQLLAATNVITPQIKQALAEAAQIRADCQAHMLEHFYEVAATMPPDQGKRYLQWVWEETLKTQVMLPGRMPAGSSPQMQ